MLKKIFAFLFTIIIYYLLTTPVNSQNIDPKDMFGGTNIPGITCGNADQEEINQCCTSNLSTDLEIKDPHFWCIPLGGPCASELPSLVFDKFFKNSDMYNKIKDLEEVSKDGTECVIGEASNPGASDCICKKNALADFCSKYLKDNLTEKNSCLECVGNKKGVWTSLGCVGSGVSGFVSSISSILLSIAGGIAFLCIILSAVMLQTSAGNPERIKKARQYLTSCITGLLLIIFSIFILRLIGVNILRIPGFD